MRWSRRELLRMGASMGLLPLAETLRRLRPDPVRLVFTSDTHIGLARNLRETEPMVAEILALKPTQVLVIGDVLDYGFEGEARNFKRLFDGLPIEASPGNHDVRWSPQGLALFEKHFGLPYRRFAIGGAEVLLLDSTVPLSHWGNIHAVQVRWLERQLDEIGVSRPVLVFAHHWFGREAVMVDNERLLLDRLARANVVFMGFGHGHSDLVWSTDGVPSVMNKGLYQGSYTVLEWSPGDAEFSVWRRTSEVPRAVLGSYPFQRARLSPVNVSRTSLVTAGSIPLLGAREIRLEGGTWQAQAGEVALPRPVPGHHRVLVRDSARGAVKTIKVRVPDAPGLEHVRSVPLPGGVMSHLRLNEEEVFVSCMDGSVVCFDARTLGRKWVFECGGFCHSSPLVTAEFVYVGSADGKVRGLDRKTGRLVWDAELPGPVYSSPAMAKGVLFVAHHGAFYGFDRRTGLMRWTTKMPESNTNFAQSVATTDGERFLIGAWDSHFYALGVEHGELLWRLPCMPRTFAFSPAISSPDVQEYRSFVAANGNGLFCFDNEKGEKVWEVASPGEKFGHSSARVLGDRVFAGCLGDRGQVRAVRVSDGQEIWMCETGAVIYDSSPALADGWLFIGSVDGTLSKIAQATGKLDAQWRLPPGHQLSTPAAGNGHVYAASLGGELVQLKYSREVRSL